MKLDKTLKNIGLGVLAFLVAYGIFQFAGITIDPGFWLVSILLVLIYFEIMDLHKKK